MKKLKMMDPSSGMNIVYDGAENISLADYKLMNWRNIHE